MDEQNVEGTTDEETTWVSVLSITHRHGADQWVHRTEDGAWASLGAYVCEYWDEVFEDDEPIEEFAEDDRILQYFERRQTESLGARQGPPRRLSLKDRSDG